MSFVQTMPTSYGGSVAGSKGIAVLSGAGAGIYTTTPVVLIASTDYDTDGFMLTVGHAGSYSRETLRLYVGASGSEVELVTIPAPVSDSSLGRVFVPIPLPAGTRLSAAACDSAYQATTSVLVALFRGTSVGKNAARGTLYGLASNDFADVDAGATIDTKGAWVALAASTTNDAKGFSLFLCGDESTDTNANFLHDVGVGAAAAEVVICADIGSYMQAYRGPNEPYVFGPIWTPIPAGSRVAVRCQCSTNAATSRVPKAGIVLWE